MAKKLDLKEVKKEVLTKPDGRPASEAEVRQFDVIDMMLTEAFNPHSRVPHARTLSALALATDTNEEHVRTILKKHDPSFKG